MTQTLGSVADGKVVEINESGSTVDYIVVHQGLPSSSYDSSCEGTWLLRRDIAENQQWNSSVDNALESSDIQSYLNGTWIDRYDTDIRNAIKQVKIPYRYGGGSSGADRDGTRGLSCKIFLLSGREVGFTTSMNSNLPNDGFRLDYFTSGDSQAAQIKRKALLDGDYADWWLRSPTTANDDSAFAVSDTGIDVTGNTSRSYGVRPAFILPQDLFVKDNKVITQLPFPSITVPSVIMRGQPINVSWTSVSGAGSYILQRKADSGGWEQVYAGNDLAYTDTAGSWTTVQYQVCGVFDGINSAFTQSDPISIIPASALVISGSDGDLGTVTSDISYNVTSDTGNQINLTWTVNGALAATLTVNSGFSHNIPVMDLPTGTGTIVITATVQASSGLVTAIRTWTYTKAAQTFPSEGGIASLSYGAQPIFPQTLAEAVKAIGGPWGGNLSKALDKLAWAVTYSPENGELSDLWGNVIPPSVRIATGSYTGNGAYAAGSPNTLQAPGNIIFAIIFGPSDTSSASSWRIQPLIVGQTSNIAVSYAATLTTDGAIFNNVSISGSTLQWSVAKYPSDMTGAQGQYNTSGETYAYAILYR